MMESLRDIFFKIDRIHYSMFDVGRSMFDVHYLLLLINLAAFHARGRAAPESCAIELSDRSRGQLAPLLQSTAY